MKKKLTKITTIEPKFEIGDVVMLKENVLMVEIGDIKIKSHRYLYKVRYAHLYRSCAEEGWFEVFEDELQYKPHNYEELLLDGYITYRYKYETLIRNLEGKELSRWKN